MTYQFRHIRCNILVIQAILQLRVGGRAIDFLDQDNVVPWVEMLDTDFLNGTALNRRPNDEQLARPRLFKSHLPVAALPAGPFKKVFVFRSAADALLSAAKFLPTLWGITDPPTAEQMVSCFLWHGDLRTMLQSLVEAWKLRHRADVLLIFYEDIPPFLYMCVDLSVYMFVVCIHVCRDTNVLCICVRLLYVRLLHA